MRKHFSSIIVTAIILLEVLFVVAVFVASANDITIPSTLITYWHITFIAELLACAGIKVSKVRHIESVEEDEEIMG